MLQWRSGGQVATGGPHPGVVIHAWDRGCARDLAGTGFLHGTGGRVSSATGGLRGRYFGFDSVKNTSVTMPSGPIETINIFRVIRTDPGTNNLRVTPLNKYTRAVSSLRRIIG